MADNHFVASPDGGIAHKDTVQVQDVKAPEPKPEETTAAPANSDVTPTTAGETASTETASEQQKPAEETADQSGDQAGASSEESEEKPDGDVAPGTDGGE